MRPDITPAARVALGDIAPVARDFRNAVVAIGSFDGVHLGHQRLIETARNLAGDAGRTLALTFSPHPRRFFQPDRPFFLLSQPESRRALLGIAGADGMVEVAFDDALAALDPEEFVTRILVDRLAVRGVVVGEGFRFGHGRSGDNALLHAAGERHGFAVKTLPPVIDPAGDIISSGRVRDALREGDSDRAEALLGYRWFIKGTVIGGDRRGRDLGYPTANLVPPETCELRFGVYAVDVRWAGRTANGVASYGVRPTFGAGQPLLEVHLFDFDGDLYGAEMTVVFRGWIRPELSFTSADLLVDQMNLDSAEARRILKRDDDESRVDQALTDWF